MVIRLLCIVLLFNSFAANVLGQLYTFKKFDHRSGLSLSSILSVQEDQNGFIWLGTDGSGLIRYDGHEFEDLSSFQGRQSHHVSGIHFSKSNQLYFATEYQGFYTSNWDSLVKLKDVPVFGKGHATIPLEDHVVIIQDAAILILDENHNLIQERTIYPLNETMHVYSSDVLDNRLFLFTSRGNFVVYDGKIEHLYDWLGTSDDFTKDLVNVVQSGDSLILVNKYLNEEVTILIDNFRPKFFIRDQLENPFDLEVGETVSKVSASRRFTVFVTNKGRILKRIIGALVIDELINNSEDQIHTPTAVIIDKNQDIWVSSKLSGVFRISLEPFTQLRFHPIYEDPKISFLGRTRSDDIFLSTFLGKTYVGNRTTNYGFDEYDFIIKSHVSFDGLDLIATNQGLKILKDTKIYPNPYGILPVQQLTFLHVLNGVLYIGLSGEGLFSFDPVTSEFKSIERSPAFIYTAQPSLDGRGFYFGSNVGVFHFNPLIGIKQISSIVNGNDLGSYCGNSATDSYGNCWFTLDHGILGILKDGTVKAIHGERFLPSNLFYTMNADRFGGLLIGTNKGITVLRLDQSGNVKSSFTYNKENGFDGYETHMRASYTDDNGNIFVATLEGVFMIRPEFLVQKNTPGAPFIMGVKSRLGEDIRRVNGMAAFGEDQTTLSIVFRSINNKNDFVRYSYRLLGKSDEWTPWSKEYEAVFTDLKSGKYTFEVRASIDENTVSDISTFEFTISIPFYKSKWFILTGIGLLVLLNVYFLERTKKFNRNNIILSKDVTTDTNGVSAILLFGAFANTASHIFASRIDETIENHDLSTAVAGLFVLILFILVAFVPKFKPKAKQLLLLGFVVIMLQNFIGLYYSDLHPFFLMAIILTCFISPFVFPSIKSAAVFAFVLVLMSFAVVFTLESTRYNEFLFMVGMFVAAFLAVFMTYIRNNSLEKLIFTSGVVNKGNALVIAFDKNGLITYNSENIQHIIDAEHTELKGMHVSDLNQYQPKFEKENKFANVDLKSEFKEGKIFVTPLFTKNSEVVYYQWSCKEFSEDVRVILGQDVTDKINLENYYEIIVHNADDLIFQTDPQANLTFVNQKCVDVFKFKEDEILNKPTSFIVHPDYKEQVRNFYKEQFVERKKTTYFEFPIIDGEGNERWLGQNVTTLFKPGADNIITGFLGLARDITERRNANAIIKEQNKDITASINYARRIQFNLLPRSAAFERYFDEFFILFRPKDIVSGDFYWLGEKNDKVILICADSTGHGVPGSFMTLLGINLLNQIILEAGIVDAGEILNQLDERLVEVLPRDGRNKIKDGIEMVVCVFEKDTEEVSYACAGGRFALMNIETNALDIIKGDQKHIGDIIDGQETYRYTSHQLSVSKNQTMYLFTDGYPDQFGGERNKKLTFKKYMALLDAIVNQPLAQQNQILKEHLKEWIGEYLQTDDITVIAVKGKNVKA